MIKKNAYYILLLILLLTAIFPFAALSFFNYPSADDMIFSAVAKIASVGQNIKGAYFGWSGRYFSNFIITINPLVFGWETGYKLFPVFLIALTYVGLLLFVKSFFKNHFTDYRIEALIWLTLLVQLVPSPVEAFYWISGSMAYTLPYIFLFSLVFLLKSKSRAPLTLAAIGISAFILSGTNELIMVFTFELLLLLFILNAVYKKPLAKISTALVFCVIGIIINIAAPGNYRRLDFFPLHGNFSESIISSAFSFFRLSVHLFTEPALWVLLLIVFIHGLHRNFQFPEYFASKKVVRLLPILSIFISASMFFPAYYAMGIALPPRIYNCVTIAMVLLLIVNAAVWGNYYGLAKTSKLIATPNLLTKWLTVIAVIFLFTGIQKRPGEQLKFTSNITNAWNDLLFEAIPYKEEMNERLEKVSIAQQNEADTLTLEPFKHKPYTIFYTDIKEDPTHWINISFSEYYHLKCVKLQNENPHDANISGKGN